MRHRLGIHGWGQVASASLLLAVFTSGCAAFLPAHTNSNKKQGESVSVHMISLRDAQAEVAFKSNYQAAFKQELPESPKAFAEAKAVPVAAGAALLAGFAMDVVSKELGRAATMYEAQFGVTIIDDQFWVRTGDSARIVRRTNETEKVEAAFSTKPGGSENVWHTNRTITTLVHSDESVAFLKQNYCGFEITRAVEGETHAFRLVCGIAPSADKQLFQIAPLLFETKKAKAKVLSNQPGWCLLPTTWFGRLFRTPGRELDTAVDVEINAYWRSKDQEVHVTKVAALTMKFTGYDISNPKEWSVVNGKLTARSGWLLGVPVSYDESGKPVGLGTFTLKVTVTEKDTSNAKQYMETASELVEKKQPAITDAVEKSLK